MKKISVFKTFGIIISSFLGFNSQAQTISSTLDGRTDLVAGLQSDFEVTTTSGTMNGSTVTIFITLSDTNLSSTVHAEFYNPLTTIYEPLTFVSGVAQFGSLIGFPLLDATSEFRVVFDSATTYDYTLEVLDSTSAVIASSSESVTINAYQASTILSNLNGQTGLLQSLENDFTIYLTGGNDTNKMVWLNMTLADSTLANSIQLSYFDGTAYQPLFFGVNGETRIGGVTGINLQDDSIQMKVIFDSATTYDYSLSIEEISSNMMLSSVNESVIVSQFFASTLSSTLNGRVGIYTGNQDTFSINTFSGSLVGETVLLNAQLADPNLSNQVHIEYFDGTTFQPLTFDMNGSLTFEPTSGYTLADAITEYRVIFDSATTYDYTLELVKLSDLTTIATTNESVTVAQTIPSVIISTLNGRTGISTGNQDTFSVSVTSGTMLGELVMLNVQLADSNLSNQVHLEYFDGTSFQPLTFNTNGSLMFGPSGGFPLADATTEFRVTFDSATTYDFSFQIFRFSDSTLIAESNESITIDQTIEAIILSTLNGRTGLITSIQDTFSVSVISGSMLGEMVMLKAHLVDSNLYNDVHLEYFDGTTFQPLTFNTDGSVFVGSSTGFPLADATTEFRVTFDSATTYDYSFQIIKFDDSTVIAESNESVTIGQFITSTISSTLDARTGLKVGMQDTFSISTTAGSHAGKLVVISLQLADANLYNSINLEYFDGTTFQPLTFSTGGTMIFGSVAGFPLADATTDFRVVFDSATTFDYTLSILDASTSDVLITKNESVTIENIDIPATISTTLNGRTAVFTNTNVNFVADIIANSDSAKTVQLKLTLLDAGLNDFVNLSFFNGSSFVNLPFTNGVATYGSTGFNLADQKIPFVIEFDTATTVDYKIEIIEMSSGNTIASATESVVIERNTTNGINISNNINFTIMPNPANDFIYIDYDKNAVVNIYDISGKLLKTTNITDNKSVNISEFNNGTYYIQVVDNNNFSTQKLVIIH